MYLFFNLKKTREDICWLASDDKQTGVQLAQACIQVLQTMQQKPEKEKDKLFNEKVSEEHLWHFAINSKTQIAGWNLLHKEKDF